jgi:pentapeptide repeat protein
MFMSCPIGRPEIARAMTSCWVCSILSTMSYQLAPPIPLRRAFDRTALLDLNGAYLLEFSLSDCQLDFAEFPRAQFTGRAYFGGAQFTEGADFEGARIASAAQPGSVWPPGWTTQPAQPDNGEDPAFLYLARAEDGNPPDT